MEDYKLRDLRASPHTGFPGWYRLHSKFFFFLSTHEKRSQMQAISLRAAYRALLRISTSVPSEGPEGRNNLAKVRLLAICMYAPTFVLYVIYGPSCQCID